MNERAIACEKIMLAIARGNALLNNINFLWFDSTLLNSEGLMRTVKNDMIVDSDPNRMIVARTVMTKYIYIYIFVYFSTFHFF